MLQTSSVFFESQSHDCHLPSTKFMIMLSDRFMNSFIMSGFQSKVLSFENIHKMNKRAMPEALMSYKCAIQLHKLYNSNDHSLEWISLNCNQILTTRQTNFIIMKTNVTTVGFSIMCNRLSVLNGLIPLSWLNITINIFKISCF